MQTKLQKMKTPTAYYCGAFYAAAIITIICFAASSVAPWGEYSILTCDMSSQYVAFFAALRRIIYGDASLMYSWTRTLGGEFLGIYGYYLASPFSYIVALFPENQITTALYVMEITKIGFACVSMAWFLHYKRNNQYKPSSVIFALSYALSAYMLLYKPNTMWIDGVIMLPILMHSIERFVDAGTWKRYVGILSATIIFNFYIGYMSCIFVVLYYCYYYWSQKRPSDDSTKQEMWKNFVVQTLKLAGASIVACLLACIVLYPMLHSMLMGKTSFAQTVGGWMPELRNPLDVLGGVFPSGPLSLLHDGTPLLYCGTLTIILCALFFANNHFTKRERISAGILILAMATSMCIGVLDKMWHCFATPVCLNYRYSFMLIAIFVMLAAQSYENIEKTSKRNLLVVLGCTIAGLIISCLWRTGAGSPLIIPLCILTGMVLIAGIPMLRGIQKNKSAAAAFFLCLVLELIANGMLSELLIANQTPYISNQDYKNFQERYVEIVEDVYNMDNDFYRLEKVEHRGTNDNTTLNIRGLTASSSTLHGASLEFLHQLGFSRNEHSIHYFSTTELGESLVGLKYIISPNAINKIGYELIKTYDNGLNLYKNTNALPIGYAVKEDAQVFYEEDVDTLTRLNEIVKSWTSQSENNVFDIYDAKYTGVIHDYKEDVDQDLGTINLEVSTYVTYEVSLPEKASQTNIYAYLPYGAMQPIMMDADWVTDGYPANKAITIPQYTKTENNVYIFSVMVHKEIKSGIDVQSVESFKKMYETNFEKNENEYKHVKCATINEDAYNKAINELQKFSIHDVVAKSETHIMGTITVDANHPVLMTTIPYDASWEIIVDGKKIATEKMANSMIGATLEQGTHSVEFVYHPKQLWNGLILSCIGIGLFSIGIFFTKKKKQ